MAIFPLVVPLLSGLSARTAMPFDYVLVGGGTAGCVLANRLSADPSKRVLVLEPGRSPRASLKVAAPVALTKLFHSSWDWKFGSTPTAETAGRRVHLARGKALGGSSAFNALLYHRGSPEDFDAWELPGWGSKNWLAAFCAVEHQARPDLACSVYHGVKGPVTVEDARYTNPLSERFIEASLQAGFCENLDFNDWSKGQEGVGRFQLQTRRGRRAHAAATHLRPAMRRPNLVVQSGATVSRVLLDDENKATGVAYLDERGDEHIVSVAGGGADGEDGEVILCAGAINTPQLLMLSGVGPRDELTKHGIPVAVELPGVGKNLADHPAVVTGFTINKPISITDEMFLSSGILNPRRVAQWATLGSGPLATTGCDFGGFFRTEPSLPLPDLQMRFVAGLGTSPDGVSSYRDIGRTGQPRSGITFQSVAVRPRARGTLTLASADPAAPPLIDPAFGTSAEDLRTLREGVRLARRIASQPAFEGLCGEETWPGPAVESDAALDDYIAHTLHSANGIAGSCKMGLPNDAMAVVDTELRVRGTHNLRVVDVSVLPTMPGGQLGASAFALAEQASKIITGAVVVPIPEECDSTAP